VPHESNFPRGAPKPAPGDVVAVLMTEEMARTFEARCLGAHTRGPTELAGPMLFREDDVPTYIIGVK
jgi:hypothetical protein